MLSPTSVYDTLFASEVTVATIYFVLFTLYETLKERRGYISRYELDLMIFSMGFMMVSLGAMGTVLFIQSCYPEILSGIYVSHVLVGILISLVWFSMFFVFLQAFLIYKRLREGR
jgi:hypothetical protein